MSLDSVLFRHLTFILWYYMRLCCCVLCVWDIKWSGWELGVEMLLSDVSCCNKITRKVTHQPLVSSYVCSPWKMCRVLNFHHPHISIIILFFFLILLCLSSLLIHTLFFYILHFIIQTFSSKCHATTTMPLLSLLCCVYHVCILINFIKHKRYRYLCCSV